MSRPPSERKRFRNVDDDEDENVDFEKTQGPLKRARLTKKKEESIEVEDEDEDEDEDENEDEDEDDEDNDDEDVGGGALSSSSAAAASSPASSSAAAATAAQQGPFILKAAQEVVVERCVTCCRESGRFVNESDGGQGKTVQTVEAAHRLRLPILVIGLAGTMPRKWDEHARRQRVHMVQYHSWDGIRGRAPISAASHDAGAWFSVKLNHPWLTREDAWTGRWAKKTVRNKLTKEKKLVQTKIYDTRYEASPQLVALIDAGVMVVADEIQKAKNASLQSSALACITSVLFRKAASLLAPGKNGSCIVALSATTLDKPEHALRICRAIGLLPAIMGKAFEYDKGSSSYHVNNGGVDRLLKLCRRLDSVAYLHAEQNTLHNQSGYVYTDQRTGLIVNSRDRRGGGGGESWIRREQLKSKDRPDWFLLALYTNILRKQVAGAVSERFDVDPDVTLDYRNVVYLVQADKQEAFNALTAQLERMRQQGATDADMGPVQRKLETIKADLFIHAPREVLKADPHAKVVILMNFIEGILDVGKALEKFGVVYYYGAVSKLDREKALAAFQAPNSAVRVFVGQVVAASEGIDLHDTTGLWPRTSFISPSSKATSLQQALKRTKRVGVKGKVTVVMVYGGSGELLSRGGGEQGEQRVQVDEATVMQNLISKSGRMKSVAQQQVLDGVVFLDNLPTYRETTPGHFVLAALEESSSSSSSSDSDKEERKESHDKDYGYDDGSDSDDKRGDKAYEAYINMLAGTDSTTKQVAAPLLFRTGDRVQVHVGKDGWRPGVVVGIDRNSYRVATQPIHGGLMADILPARVRSPSQLELATQRAIWRKLDPDVPAAAAAAAAASSKPASSSSSSSSAAAAAAAKPSPPANNPNAPAQVGVKLANGLACLSNDWPTDASRASIDAVKQTNGDLPPGGPASFGFTLHGRWFPTVTHYVHSSLALPQAKSEEVRLAATTDRVRELWPLPTAQGGANAPNVRRLVLEGMRAKFNNPHNAYSKAALIATGKRPFAVTDSRSDHVDLLTSVRNQMNTASAAASSSHKK